MTTSAQQWVADHLEELNEKHGFQYLLVSEDTLKYVAGDSRSHCENMWPEVYGPLPPQSSLYGIQLM